jgi:carboxylesterase type B
MYFHFFYIALLAQVTWGLWFQFESSSAHVTDSRTNITYQGIPGDGIETFLNIPFGQDTRGAGRFLLAKAFVPAHNTIVNATVAGAACPQPIVPIPDISGLLSNVTNVSEDCLSLRITKPSSIDKHAKLPVMVFIYSGAFQSFFSKKSH